MKVLFFFQAEDGIRDHCVTGVQTCALPIFSDLARSGFSVHVFTHGLFGADVERAGANLVDVFAEYPLDHADSESMPFPCRYVSYAGTYAQEIVDKVKKIGPAPILCETFSVIGRVA